MSGKCFILKFTNVHMMGDEFWKLVEKLKEQDEDWTNAKTDGENLLVRCEDRNQGFRRGMWVKAELGKLNAPSPYFQVYKEEVVVK